MKKRIRQKGVTLIELLVVLIIIALLATLAFGMLDVTGGARQTTAKSHIKELEANLSAYKAQSLYYPTNAQGLEALVSKPTEEPVPRRYPAGGYVTRIPKDPWGREYIYLSPGDRNPHSYDLYTYGRDGKEGGEGEDQDIGNWNLNEIE